MMNKKEKSLLINKELDKLYPNPKCELEFTRDYELLLSVMLSAQTTDKRVNMCTKPLYEKYDSLEKLDSLSIEEIEKYIKSIGMYRQKSRHFKNITRKLIELGGIVPKDRETLESLDGVGRKTANVVLSNLYNYPLIAVDTHVSRVSKRLGLAKENDTPLIIEQKLMKSFEKNTWSKIHYQMVLFGRYKCKAIKPECTSCPFHSFCKEKNKNYENSQK